MTDIIGIDYGSKYIGIARGSAEAGLAQPYAVWPNDKEFINQLRRFVVETLANTLVIGLPLNLEGDETAQAGRTRSFGSKIATELNITVVYQAESATSIVAGSKQKTRGVRVDDRAAAIILQDYLDRNRHGDKL